MKSKQQKTKKIKTKSKKNKLTFKKKNVMSEDIWIKKLQKGEI